MVVIESKFVISGELMGFANQLLTIQSRILFSTWTESVLAVLRIHRFSAFAYFRELGSQLGHRRFHQHFVAFVNHWSLVDHLCIPSIPASSPIGSTVPHPRLARDSLLREAITRLTYYHPWSASMPVDIARHSTYPCPFLHRLWPVLWSCLDESWCPQPLDYYSNSFLKT